MHEKDTCMGASARAVAGRHAPRWRGVARACVAVAAQGALAGGLLLASSAWANAAPASHHAVPHAIVFADVVNAADPTFNQLLGINSHNVIAGYFGSGAAGHPNKGYLADPPTPPGTFVNENFPGSVQTQVTGIDNKGNTSGFWVSGNGTNHGFVEWNGVFASFSDPKTPHQKGSVNQLLGINNSGVAVGFHNDGAGVMHGFTLKAPLGPVSHWKTIDDPSPSAMPGTTVVNGVNDLGDLVGFYTNSAGNTIGMYVW